MRVRLARQYFYGGIRYGHGHNPGFQDVNLPDDCPVEKLPADARLLNHDGSVIERPEEGYTSKDVPGPQAPAADSSKSGDKSGSGEGPLEAALNGKK